MIKFLRPIIIAFFLIFIFISCNDDPTSVPSKLIPDEDKVVFNVFDTKERNVKQSTGFFEKLENLYGGDKRLLGQNEYAKSSILYHWDIFLPDSTLGYINSGEVTVDTALVTMKVSYHLKYIGPISFTVQPLQGEWSLTGLKRDSLKYITNDGDPNILASQINEPDSATVSFLINKDVVNNWLKFEADTSLTNTNYGIILKPTAATKGFIGFNSNYYSADSVETTLRIVLNKSSQPFDTVVVYPDKDLHIVESIGNLPTSSQDKIYLEGGYALRGNLFIDVSSLPKDIAVIKAILELSVDSLNSVDGNPSSDSLLVLMVADSTNNELTSDSTVTSVLRRVGNKFTGNITWIVQKWINGTENQGLQLVLYDELSSAAKIILYGSKENNTALRPKLTIHYPKRI